MFPVCSIILLHQGVQIATVIQTEQVRCLRIWEQRTLDSRGPGKRRAAIRPRLVSTYPARVDLNPGGGPSQMANNRVGGAAERLVPVPPV